jgi:hypothetical protein
MRLYQKTSTSPIHPGKPWFNDDCKGTIKNSKKAEQQFEKQASSEILGNFRIFRAKALRTLKQNRRTSWRNFISKLNCHTPINKV